MVRKNAVDKKPWDDTSTTSNYWPNSDLLSWLNSNYKNLFSSTVQDLIGTTKYIFTLPGGAATLTTRSDACFTLSVTEYGLTSYKANVEGSNLPIANTLLTIIQQYQGCWTRSILIGGSKGGALEIENGQVLDDFTTENYNFLPVFTLPKNAFVDSNLALIET